ncbi:arylalkylamine N-acetyltransferase 1-like isoform X2 [Bombus pyrosoma]|uniref:arylalkylamine N-acetyltransferase 1-like isoform X2 n=1 Tax=Bombus pyrosoma TaxID=396416 RepID=UPI001CB8A07A|nr:arylalkylamine N-acetyltransferase 1-like isoform X2 [Bombus pyrosoma]
MIERVRERYVKWWNEFFYSEKDVIVILEIKTYSTCISCHESLHGNRLTLADSANGERIDMDYQIQVITRNDKLKILNFLRKFFFRDEPLNQSVQLLPEREAYTCRELEDYSLTCFENNLNLMAVLPNGTLVGVILNGKMDRSSNEEPQFIARCRNPKFKKILKLLHYVDQNVNCDDKFQGLDILEIKIISVDSNWRGKGVGKALLERTLEIGKERGFHMARADCSSSFSGKLCTRMGFERIYELNYKDYVDEDGNPVFTPAFPHTEIVSYIKKL